MGEMMVFYDKKDAKSYLVNKDTISIDEIDEKIEEIVFHDYERLPHLWGISYYLLSGILIYTLATGLVNKAPTLWTIALFFYIVTYPFAVKRDWVQLRIKTNKGERKAGTAAHDYFEIINAMQDKVKKERGESLEKEYWGAWPHKQSKKTEIKPIT